MHELTQAASSTSPFDALRREDASGEWWSARDLVTPLGYTTWRRFEDAVSRAVAAIRNAGGDPTSEIVQVPKVSGTRVKSVNSGTQAKADYRLSGHRSHP